MDERERERGERAIKKGRREGLERKITDKKGNSVDLRYR